MGSNYKEFEQELFLKLSLFPIPFCLIPLPGFISTLPGVQPGLSRREFDTRLR